MKDLKINHVENAIAEKPSTWASGGFERDKLPRTVVMEPIPLWETLPNGKLQGMGRSGEFCERLLVQFPSDREARGMLDINLLRAKYASDTKSERVNRKVTRERNRERLRRDWGIGGVA